MRRTSTSRLPLRCLGPLCAAALVLQGCFVGSLHPAYDEDSIVFDTALLGTWEEQESHVQVVVSRGEWRSYHIAYTDRLGTTKFTGHLFTLGDARLLNVRPEDGLERPAYLVVTNGVVHVRIESGRVRVRELDYATMLARLGSGRLGLDAAADLKDNVVLTAPTPRLRAWLRASLADPTAWADWKTLTRTTQ
jgi:hypothetical protein